MPIKLNVFCNGQIAANKKYLSNFDQVDWGPGHVERDELGIPIKKSNRSPSLSHPGQEDSQHVAHLPKR